MRGDTFYHKIYKRIGAISGCFDAPLGPLHLGHQYILQEAKKECDHLIVFLNNDDYIRDKKGRNPMLSAGERYFRLRKTGLVNKVFIFEGNTPIELIRKWKPDILFLGFERENYVIPWEEEVKEWGAEIKIIPKLEGYSSTKIYEQYAKN